jgi:predicted metalloendopeptidase
MPQRRPLVLAVFASLALTACAGAPRVAEAPAEAEPKADAAAAPRSNLRGLDLANFDQTVGACEDFYVYSNGNWLRNNPVPAAFSTWGTFNELEVRNNERLRAIAAAAADRIDVAPGSPEALVGAFYAAAMDEATIEARGLDPIRPELDAIAALRTPADVARLIRDWQTDGVGVLYGFFSRQDLKDNTRVIAYATQGGLGLPNRDFYTREDDESAKLRAQYVEHIANQLAAAGTPPSSNPPKSCSAARVRPSAPARVPRPFWPSAWLKVWGRKALRLNSLGGRCNRCARSSRSR